jgi:hypothetical protein
VCFVALALIHARKGVHGFMSIGLMASSIIPVFADDFCRGFERGYVAGYMRAANLQAYDIAMLDITRRITKAFHWLQRTQGSKRFQREADGVINNTSLC